MTGVQTHFFDVFDEAERLTVGERSFAADDRSTAAPRNQSDTSAAAAEAAAPKLTARMQTALQLIRERDGATNDELTDLMGLPIQSICPVTNRLFQIGKIRDSGRTRPTRTGSPAKEWIATGVSAE